MEMWEVGTYSFKGLQRTYDMVQVRNGERPIVEIALPATVVKRSQAGG
jgi:hypothetical protein